MKHYNLGFGTRREIRSQIEEAANKLGITLQQRTIENLVTDRITQIGQELATGKTQEVNWGSLVHEAHHQEEADRAKWNAVADRLPGEEE